MTIAQTPLNLDLLCAKQGFCIATEVTLAILNHKEKDETGKPIPKVGIHDDPKRTEKAAKSAENLITRTLGVLQGQGIYAAFLLLEAKKETGYIPLRTLCVKLIETVIHHELEKPEEILRTLEKADSILSSLPTLLLVKRTMERALTYARYHAKAQGGE